MAIHSYLTRKGDEDNKVNDHERRDSFTLISKTSAIEPVCRHKTEEKGGGGEETLVEASIHGGKDVANEEVKDRAAVEFMERQNAARKEESRTGRNGRRSGWYFGPNEGRSRWEPFDRGRPGQNRSVDLDPKGG